MKPLQLALIFILGSLFTNTLAAPKLNLTIYNRSINPEFQTLYLKITKLYPNGRTTMTPGDGTQFNTTDAGKTVLIKLAHVFHKTRYAEFKIQTEDGSKFCSFDVTRHYHSSGGPEHAENSLEDPNGYWKIKVNDSYYFHCKATGGAHTGSIIIS